MCYHIYRIENALVAQLDRVSDYESEGRGFESLPARHVAASLMACRIFYAKIRLRFADCRSSLPQNL